MDRIGKITPGEGAAPVFYRKENPGDKIEEAEEITPDAKRHSDTVEISKQGRELLDKMKENRPKTETKDDLSR